LIYCWHTFEQIINKALRAYFLIFKSFNFKLLFKDKLTFDFKKVNSFIGIKNSISEIPKSSKPKHSNLLLHFNFERKFY